tara:strand:+ start:170 stop:415 length:246 start_codon:yes stop_codon:yes gene_type:complete
MNNSNKLFEKFGKLLEESITNYKDISSQIINICKSKRDDFIFKMKITSKEETEILKKRVEKLEKKIEKLEKVKRPKRAKKP